jgi:cytochrome d ubiquinol oxidase subunit I
MGPTGYIALLAGWFTTEVGRQPWVVYGVLRLKMRCLAVSADQVGITLIIFVIVYTVVFGTAFITSSNSCTKDHNLFIHR